MDDHESSIQRFHELLTNAVDNEDWATAATSRDRLKVLLLDALLSGKSRDIALIENALSRVRAKLIFDRDIDLNVGPNATAWMLASDVGTARLAQRLRPLLPDTGVEPSVRDKVFKAISTSNLNGISNSDIQKRTGLRAETVTRALSTLRAEGSVRSRKVGRLNINQIAIKPKTSLTIADVRRIVVQEEKRRPGSNAQRVIFPLINDGDSSVSEVNNVRDSGQNKSDMDSVKNAPEIYHEVTKSVPESPGVIVQNIGRVLEANRYAPETRKKSVAINFKATALAGARYGR
ncbi:hypothetical protein NKI59_02290 [Mesorhizobium sp. M0598]|uniref:hypothetical protein n=1 Tax=Mesorhizobium sp. M0598 TaxID=2956968 RepID=UPI00333BC440